MREAVRTAKSEVARRERELKKAEAERNSWQADWAEAVAAIDLRYDAKPDIVSAQIIVIDEIREHAAAARNLRDKRIFAIERDIEIFERTVGEIAVEFALELTDGDADASVVELDRRREEALKLHQQHRELTDSVGRAAEEDRGAGGTSKGRLDLCATAPGGCRCRGCRGASRSG